MSVIATATNTVIATIPQIGFDVFAVAVSPDGSKVYMTYAHGEGASAIDTATNTVSGGVFTDQDDASGVSVTPDGREIYVTYWITQSLSVFNAETGTVIATIPAAFPVAFGNFIQPTPRFAGTPGKANCYGQSISALSQRFGGLNNAAVVLGLPSIRALQSAVMAFCEEPTG
jgi:YVTN family beta-propeller protein